MWEATVAPAIAAALPSRRMIRHRRIKCFGVGESDLEAMLPDMIRRKREPLVGITVSGATITLRITASGPHEAACLRAIEPTVQQIYEILGALVFGEEEDELEHAVLRLLSERKQTIAVVEWATDGLVSQWLAEAAAETGEFRMGVVVRDAASAAALLGIELPTGSEFEPLTAEAMARAIRDITGADYGLAIAAFPPNGLVVPTAASGKPVSTERTGVLQLALASRDNVRTKGFPLASHPAITKPRAAKQALNMLRLAMLNHPA
jgi:nicotinamide-nucleotide amidase